MVTVVEIDTHGRLYIPSHIRSRIKYRKFRIELVGDFIVLKPVRPAVDKYYGIAAPAEYGSPEEVDRAVEDATKEILEGDLR